MEANIYQESVLYNLHHADHLPGISMLNKQLVCKSSWQLDETDIDEAAVVMDMEDNLELDITSLDNESTYEIKEEIEETSIVDQIWPCLLLLPFLLFLVIYAVIVRKSLQQVQLKNTSFF